MCTVTTDTVDERVSYGMSWLDSYIGPDWSDSISVTTLEIRESHLCILGQLFGRYENAPVESNDWAAERGFNVFYCDQHGVAQGSYNDLNAAWKTQVNARQKQRAEMLANA